MTTLIITRGLPASGKTTWAKAWLAEDPGNRARVNRDDLRAMLFSEPTYEWAQEEQVTAIQRATVAGLLGSGKDVVCDDTNLRPKYVREWQRFADGNGVEVFSVIDHEIDADEAVRRDVVRSNPVGEEVIRRMAQKFMPKGKFLPLPEAPSEVPAEVYVAPPGLPTAVLVDIDGTVAIKHPDRDIYDLSRVHEDLPNGPVIEAVRAARLAGHEVIFCSGRDAVARECTEEWLATHVAAEGEQLYMRTEGDRRRDSIVKRELFDLHVRDRYDVQYVLDDRNQVVEMWRGLGLTCMQVAEGNF